MTLRGGWRGWGSREKARPNVVLILSDDQGSWAMGCAGNREILTQRLNFVAADEVRFERFFWPSQVYSPARPSLLTGRVPSQHVACDEYGPVRMIRTREWNYVHRYLYGPHDLYDMVNNTDEGANLIDDVYKQEIATTIKAMLEDWCVRYEDPSFDGTHEPVTGKSQVGLAGPTGRGRPAFCQEGRMQGRHR